MSQGDWVLGKLSRHSLILVVAGFTFAAVGYSFKYYEPGTQRWAGVVLAREIMDLRWWSTLFIVAGLLTSLVAHWPSVGRIWGYTILAALSTVWAAVYALGILWGAPKANISTAIIWSSQAFVWWAISGLPDISQGKARMPKWTGSRKRS